MANSVSIKFDAAAVNAALDKLQVRIQEQVRPAAQAGAQVLYDQVLVNVPKSLKGHWFHGSSFRKTGQKYWFDSGTLRKSIYQVFSKDNSGSDHATYHIAWNHRQAPYGFMVHNGTSKTPAHPFLFDAFDAKQGDAIKTAKTKFEENARTVITELSR